MSKNNFVSVIVPVHNQNTALFSTLTMFNYQQYDRNNFEVLVIDDGSDEIDFLKQHEFIASVQYNLRIIRQENGGRAKARNRGVKESVGDYLIFCDADRFPNPNLIQSYVERLRLDEKKVLIGCPMDFYGILSRNSASYDWDYIENYSRKQQYYDKVSQLYDNDGFTKSKIAWITFLAGNLCISRSTFHMSNGFLEEFTEWGFEHFELGFRLLQKGVVFQLCNRNANYHFPHKRDNEFYRRSMKESIEIMNKVHTEYHFDAFLDFMFGMISLQEFEKRFTGHTSVNLVNRDDIFFKQISRVSM